MLTNHLLPRFARLRLSQIDYFGSDGAKEPTLWPDLPSGRATRVRLGEHTLLLLLSDARVC